jgi:putative peptide zinc metalloprotease protein
MQFHLASTINLHPLSITTEGDELIVGRIDTGEFVALPPIGGRLIELLQSGASIAAIEAQIAREVGEEVEVGEFVATLGELGFVRAVDGQPLSGVAAPNDHGAWLKPQLAALVFSQPLRLGWALLLVLALGTLLQRPELLPRYQDFFWTPLTSGVVLGNTLLSWALVVLHELGHLVAVRSLGLPGRLSLGTRLYHLVAQVDVSALWAVPRARRYRVYLAGMAVDLTIAALALLLLAYAPLTDLAARLLRVVILLCGFNVVWQFHGYLRTDLYYVLANALRCGNLYADSIGYLRQRWRRARGGTGDPLTHVPAAERRAVRRYAWVLLAGVGLALLVGVFYRLPIWVTIYSAGYRALVNGVARGDLVQLADGAITLGVNLAFDAILLATLVRGIKKRRDGGEYRPAAANAG